MKDNALISIKTIQDIDGDEEEISLDTGGKYAIRNHKVYIIYNESIMTGYEGTTTTIRVSRDEIKVSRKGRFETKMNYREGEKNLCLVNTPYGQIGAAVTTKRIKFDFGGSGGFLDMDYLLDADNVNYIKNKMTVSVRVDPEIDTERVYK